MLNRVNKNMDIFPTFKSTPSISPSPFKFFDFGPGKGFAMGNISKAMLEADFKWSETPEGRAEQAKSPIKEILADKYTNGLKSGWSIWEKIPEKQQTLGFFGIEHINISHDLVEKWFGSPVGITSIPNYDSILNIQLRNILFNTEGVKETVDIVWDERPLPSIGSIMSGLGIDKTLVVDSISDKKCKCPTEVLMKDGCQCGGV